MELNIDYFILARALHLVGVVLWIGGVGFVTTVLIPSLIHRKANSKLELFEQFESKFARQAKLVTLVTGLSGFYMIEVLNAWDRYLHIQYWWIHLMSLIWFIFTVVLFILEPIFLHKWFHQQAIKNSERAFSWLHRLHKFLLTLSLLAVIGAVAGSHGLIFG